MSRYIALSRLRNFRGLSRSRNEFDSAHNLSAANAFLVHSKFESQIETLKPIFRLPFVRKFANQTTASWPTNNCLVRRAAQAICDPNSLYYRACNVAKWISLRKLRFFSISINFRPSSFRLIQSISALDVYHLQQTSRSDCSDNKTT